MNRNLIGLVALASSLLCGAALAQETYKIGAVNSVTGPLGAFGLSVQKGTELALDMVGRKVNGRNIVISWEDDETKPQVTAQKGAKLMASNPDLVLGSVNTPSTLALMKLSEQRKIPHLVTLGGGDQITGTDKTAYAWRTTIRLDMESRVGAQYVKSMNFKCIYGVSFDYQATRERWNNFKKLVETNTSTKICGESFSAIDNVDFALIIESALRSGADGFWIDLPGNIGTAILKQATQVNLQSKMKLFGPVVIDDESAAAIGPGAIGVSTGIRWHWSFDNPESKKFVEAYRKKYNENPDQYAGEAYDGMMWWLDNIEKQKTFDKDKLMAAFSTSVWDKSLKGRRTMRACDHQALQNGYWAEIVKGTTAAQPYQLKLMSTFPPELLFPPCS
ncbi:MAG: ABC transporter substrate-binding protein [Burkholderiaceae bacterium]